MSARNRHAEKWARRADREMAAVRAETVHRRANAPLVVRGLMHAFGWSTPRTTNRAQRRTS